MTNPQKVIKAVTPAKADVRKWQAMQGGADVRKKLGSGPKAAAEKKPAPTLPWGKLSALPRRVLIFGGAGVALVILIIVFLFFGSPRKEASSQTPTKAADLSTVPGGENFIGQPPLQKALPPEEEGRPAVQSIRFHPPQPTIMDTLKADVVTATSADPGRITYTYVWKVNNRTVEDATKDTLDLSTFKKKDLVAVTVTPYEGDKAGFPVDSPVIIIHGSPPSLDLQAPFKKTKVGEPLELQLVSLHPDSEGVTFSLEAPIVPGMSIDAQSGKITWIIQPGQKGTISFGAVVEDTDKTRVTRIFNITVEKSSVAPAPAGAGQNSRSQPELLVERR
jgi:hypothetical protein